MPNTATTVRLVDPVDGSEIYFSTNPQEIATSVSSEDASIALDAFGTLTRPIGRPPTTYSWSGTFYGIGRASDPHVQTPFWRPPSDLQYQLETWHDGQPRRTKPLELEVINGPLMMLRPVYITSLSFRYAGGFYDLGYDIGLTEWRNVLVSTWTGGGGSGEVSVGGAEQDPETGAPSIPADYIVKPGDTIWGIAEDQLGDGGRYQEIYDLNEEALGDDIDNLVEGTTLSLPGGTAAIEDPNEPAIVSYEELVGVVSE